MATNTAAPTQTARVTAPPTSAASNSAVDSGGMR
jgi:hypothetical protein